MEEVEKCDAEMAFRIVKFCKLPRNRDERTEEETKRQRSKRERSRSGCDKIKTEPPLTVSCFGLVPVRFLSIRLAKRSRRFVGSGDESQQERESSLIEGDE